jgi:CBS domain-containing protein
MDDVFIASLMSSPVTTVSADTPAKAAAEQMLDEGIGSVVVVDEDNHPQGILTSTDFVAIAAADQSADEFAVADYMTTDIITTTADKPITHVADLIIEYSIHHVPVVDDTEGVIGIVTTTDLTAYLSARVDADTAEPWT